MAASFGVLLIIWDIKKARHQEMEAADPIPVTQSRSTQRLRHAGSSWTPTAAPDAGSVALQPQCPPLLSVHIEGSCSAYGRLFAPPGSLRRQPSAPVVYGVPLLCGTPKACDQAQEASAAGRGHGHSDAAAHGHGDGSGNAHRKAGGGGAAPVVILQPRALLCGFDVVEGCGGRQAQAREGDVAVGIAPAPPSSELELSRAPSAASGLAASASHGRLGGPPSGSSVALHATAPSLRRSVSLLASDAGAGRPALQRFLSNAGRGGSAVAPAARG